MQTNANMLRLARQRRGFQQKQAAKLLGVGAPLLSRFENGIAEIRDDVLMRAVKAYDFPASFFYQTDPIYGAPVSVHSMWRKKSDVTMRELDSVVAELNIRSMHLRRLFEGAEVASSNDLPKLDIEDYDCAEDIAAIVRAHWRVSNGPLKDLTLLVEKAGIIVVHSYLEGTSISGVTFAVPGMPPVIVLNKKQPADRMRFTLAHELGHLVMHRFPTPEMEKEANDFAVALLVPAKDVHPYFLGRKVDLALLASLKPEWRVSMASLLMLSHKLGYVKYNQYTYLWKQMSARKLRLREPPELDFPHEKPTVLESILNVHLNGLGYSKNEISKILNVNEQELEILYPATAPEEKPNRPKFTVIK